VSQSSSRNISYLPDRMRKVISLDVREDIRNGREPFTRIMQAVAALNANEDLLLVAPFEPAPLFSVLAQQGFSHKSDATPEGDFKVLFTRNPGPADAEAIAASSVSATGAKACAGSPVMEVDARGLEPPQPLVKILEAIAALPTGVRLLAHTDRRPMHLFAQLEERGFKGESVEQKDGSYITYVERL
jgi:uncharacterized protein (DUF2249 family)